MDPRLTPLSDPAVQLRLRAASGWVDLGLPAEGLGEMSDLSPELQEHPEVLKIRFSLLRPLRRYEEALEAAERITRRAPEDKWGWLYQSHALHWLGRSGEAYQRLEPLLGRFPEAFEVPYDLACYCAQTGRLDEARSLIRQCLDLSGARRPEVRAMALQDPDLEPLWPELASGA